MRDESESKFPKSLLPKLVMRKWLNIIKSGSNCDDDDEDDEFQFDYKTKDKWLIRRTAEIERSGFGQLPLRMFVGTWNVGGNSPHDEPKLVDWLNTNAEAHAADIYVLGFQEIVPLNVGNVFGAEDSGASGKWISLTHRALNNCESKECPCRRHNYCLVASKQMVGVFLCVWAREDLCNNITSFNTCCVGTGIMGRLGNKGSVSITLTLYQTSFCFVCTHLASGEKQGDEVRRNSDVAEILKRTRFPYWPDNILDHDKTVCLGDLNYRLASSSSISQGTLIDLLENNKYQTLLEKDQLKIEHKAGRVFKDWEEGDIDFAPTYKYLVGTDTYAAQVASNHGRKRTPAWCDRILWKGKGITQICYARGESKFSDHKPVYSLFSLQIPTAAVAAMCETDVSLR